MSYSGTTSYATRMGTATGMMHEDLSDVIANISPTDTPFFSNIGKGTCNNTSPNWLVDELSAAASNAQVEGDDVSSSYSAESGPARLSNDTQILRKLVEISGTLRASNMAGTKDLLKYYMGLKMKELARDIEYALLNAEYNSSDAVASARQMRSLVGDSVDSGWLNNSTYYGTNCLYEFGSSYDASNILTEDIFNTQIQYAWEQGADVDFVLCSPHAKRTISGFNGSNRVTVNADQTAKKIVNVVDFYESDFGLVGCHAERFFNEPSDSGNYYDNVAILQKSLWEACYLRKPKTQPMAKVGDTDRVMLITELTLKAKAPKGNALIQRIAR